MSEKTIKTRKVLQYTFLPGVMPRLRQFGQTGFGWLAHLMAVIYYSVRLLPQGHPYINPHNIGRFGIRNVISEAWRHLTFKRENIDQIIVFAAILSAFALLVLQFGAIIYFFLIQPAFAASFTGLFSTPNPEQDIAFIMLDSVFGIGASGNSFFGSCVGSNSCGSTMPTLASFPSPLHEGLHALFHFYNLAILIVAVLIFLYYVLIMVAETAHTGTPFGRRFSHIWAPLRLVVALGLLVPLNYGLNSAQYITLYAAKMGSSFATYGWTTFNNTLTDPVAWSNPGPHNSTGVWYDGMARHYLVARPSSPDINPTVQFMLLVAACKVQYHMAYWNEKTSFTDIEIAPYITTSVGTATKIEYGPSLAWADALDLAGNKDIRIIFGADGNSGGGNSKYPWNYDGIYPFCGSITIPTKAVDEPGSRAAQEGMYNHVIKMFYDDAYYEIGVRLRCLHDGMADADRPPFISYPGGPAVNGCGDPSLFGYEDALFISGNENSLYSNVAFQEVAYGFEEYRFQEDVLKPAYEEIVSAMPGLLSDSKISLADQGWGGAGLWYNHLAQWNGSFLSAVKSIPFPSAMPAVMEEVADFRRKQEENDDPDKRYDPYVRGKISYQFEIPFEDNIAKALNTYYQHLRKNVVNKPEAIASSNMFYDVINAIFGIDGLWTLRENDHVHPMVQLVALGRGIVDSAIRNLMGAIGFAAVGGLVEASGKHMGGTMADMMQTAAVGVTTMGLTVGFVLYYVLPFLPFLYFFFALGAWVKGIFEAMVGVPLWALAHLRVDGNGLPGETAMNGYFLIFDIFVRPILIIFGLLASFVIFGAMVRTMNGVFTLLTANLTGFNCTGCDTSGIPIFKRAIIDEFFFTVVYAILAYMIGTSSFKLIDMIPDNLLRWMGTGAKTFSDQDGDPMANFTSYAAFSGGNIASQGVQAAVQGSRTAGMTMGTAVREIDKRLPPFGRDMKGT